MYALLSFVLLVLVVAALVDIITRQDGQVKHLPKVVWVLLVIFLPMIGSLLWFVIGHDYDTPMARPRSGAPRRRTGSASGAQATPTAQAERRITSTEEQLASLDREIEFHAEQARIRRIEAELAERRRLADGT